jgi:hypothetical protein
MRTLPIDSLRRACRIYLEHAYPAGYEALPANCRPFWDLDPSLTIEEVCVLMPPLGKRLINPPGLSIRLGCVHFRYMKLTTLKFTAAETPLWVFGVDTHDGIFIPSDDSPDHSSWQNLVRLNRLLKEKIESAWSEQNILIHTTMLRQELEELST